MLSQVLFIKTDVYKLCIVLACHILENISLQCKHKKDINIRTNELEKSSVEYFELTILYHYSNMFIHLFFL